jgi:hypothetical protein
MIRLYKLQTGEELIADGVTLKQGDGTLRKGALLFDLKRTRTVIRVPTPQGIVMLLVTYWANSPETALSIDHDQVIAQAEPSKALQDAFTQEVVGIQIARA